MSEIILTKHENNKNFTIYEGTSVELNLKDIPSIDYKWSILTTNLLSIQSDRTFQESSFHSWKIKGLLKSSCQIIHAVYHPCDNIKYFSKQYYFFITVI